jgi:5'-nucleotidase
LLRPRFIGGLTLLAVAASALHCTRPPTVTVQLLSFNDFHGTVAPPLGSQQFAADTGGAEFLSTHISRAIADNPNSLVVAAGDLIGASPLMSSFFHEEPAVLALNAMHVAVSSVGNHEFDKGTSELLRIQRGGCHPVDGCSGDPAFPGAAYEYLAANVVRRLPDGHSATLFPATSVRTVGGVKIGFIGEVLRDTSRLVQPAGIRDLTFLDEASTANRYAAELEKQGVNAIVLLIHQGGRQGQDESGEPNGCKDFKGEILPILEQLTPRIKLVVSGHAHGAYNCTIGGRTVTNSGAFGHAITRTTVTIDRATDEIRSISSRNEIATRDVPADPVETAIIARYRPLAAPLANRIVGRIARDVLRKPNDAGESALGDVIADAQLAAAQTDQAGGAEVAFMNPGGIRSNITVDHPGAAGAPGEVSYGMLYTVQPFSNVLYVGMLSGAGIKRLLEEQFHANASAATILQVSRGFSYSYRKDAPQGRHVDAASIRLNGVLVGPDAAVRFVASDFLFNGGDNFNTFEDESKMEHVVGVDLDAAVAYFGAHSPVSPGLQNRIMALQ